MTRPDNAGVRVGAWTPTGERTADLLTIFIDTAASEGFAPGTGTFLTSMTVDETGNAFTGTGDLQVREPDGTVTFEASRWTFTGTRVTVAPLPDFGAWQENTPVPGTPVAQESTGSPIAPQRPRNLVQLCRPGGILG